MLEPPTEYETFPLFGNCAIFIGRAKFGRGQRVGTTPLACRLDGPSYHFKEWFYLPKDINEIKVTDLLKKGCLPDTLWIIYLEAYIRNLGGKI